MKQHLQESNLFLGPDPDRLLLFVLFPFGDCTVPQLLINFPEKKLRSSIVCADEADLFAIFTLLWSWRDTAFR